MARPDPLDASTLEDRRRPPRDAPRVPTVRVVFRGERVVDEAARTVGPSGLMAGRSAGRAGLALAEDPLASREHAVFERAGAELVVRDLGSRNGVHVNGARAERAALSDGDVVRLGTTLVVVRHEDPRAVDVPDDELHGRSPAMQRVRVAVRRAAPSDATVLVHGETGTGKELVARALHRHGVRRGPFVAVNCTAISEPLAESLFFGHVAGAFTGAATHAEGFFRAADGGTLFLDEVGDMSPALQPKLLRALETRSFTPVGSTKLIPCDARIVAATNVGLEQAVERGAFRADLYARLAQLQIELPPLRDRPEDVLSLLRRHLGEGAPPLAPELAEALLLHRWPHNVRELLAVATQLQVWGAGQERLTLELLGDHFARGPTPARSDSEVSGYPSTAPPAAPIELPRDKAGWLELLSRHDGNLAAVARSVGRSRTQLYRLLEQHGVDRSAPPRRSSSRFQGR